MSKKQRELVEEEAVFHKRNQVNGYDTHPFESINNNQYTTYVLVDIHLIYFANFKEVHKYCYSHCHS